MEKITQNNKFGHNYYIKAKNLKYNEKKES
jgi:hypothetical protein